MMDKNSGELSIIRYIRKRFPRRNNEILKGIGDDAMIFRNGFVVSTDSFFDNIHFDLEYFSMGTLGQHIMAASLSDIAAMGAEPLCALVSLNLTRSVTFKDIRALYMGFEILSKRYAFDISGGDIVQSPGFGVTITVIGKTSRPMVRSGAKPGQGLYVTNFLGLAEVGRAVLSEKSPRKQYPAAVDKHLCPEPRIKESSLLRKYARACIDISDGLSTDANHLAFESRVKIVIDAEHVPIHSEVGKFCAMKGVEPLDFILSSGEDFELLFTAQHLPKLPRIKIFHIGRILEGQGLFISFRGKTKRIKPTGYEHLRGI
jgi:thiamine-monophosphate kinase